MFYHRAAACRLRPPFPPLSQALSERASGNKGLSFSGQLCYINIVNAKTREEASAMTFTLGTVLFIFCVQCLAYTIKGLIGFGNPLISAPLLSMRLDNVILTPGTLLMDLPINGYITWKNRREFQWRRILPLLLANVCGVVPGALLLRISLPWVLKTLLGTVVVILGLEMATRNLRSVRAGRDAPWVRLVVAFFSGICGGLFGINMFIVAYLQRSARDYSEFKGSLCFLFLGENIFRLCTYAVNGLLSKGALMVGLCSVPAAALAMLLANLLGHRLDEKKLQKAAIVLFILGGVSTIIKSVVFHT